MSTAISASTNALSSLQSYLQPNIGGTSASDPLGELLQAIDGPGQSSAPAAPASAGAGLSSPGVFDPSTFSALLGVQEQSGSGGASGAAAPHGGGGHAGVGDPLSQSSSNPDGSTTTTVTNPDGSVTTTVTSADGTENVSTTPAAQDFAASLQSFGNQASDVLSQVESMLVPLAASAAGFLL